MNQDNCVEVYIEKLNAAEDANVPSAETVKDYRDRMMEDQISPNIGYNVRGRLDVACIREGGNIHMGRTHRNGEEIPGIFITSTIKKLEAIEVSDHVIGYKIFTENSIYRLIFWKYLPQFLSGPCDWRS